MRDATRSVAVRARFVFRMVNDERMSACSQEFFQNLSSNNVAVGPMTRPFKTLRAKADRAYSFGERHCRKNARRKRRSTFLVSASRRQLAAARAMKSFNLTRNRFAF